MYREKYVSIKEFPQKTHTKTPNKQTNKTHQNSNNKKKTNKLGRICHNICKKIANAFFTHV